MSHNTIQGRVKIVSLGCPKNQCDSQGIAGTLLAQGYALCNDERQADAVIINTCSFINEARDESRATIQKIHRNTRQRSFQPKIIVAGCWAQDEPEYLAQEFPFVRAFVGNGVLPELPRIMADTHTERIVRKKPGGWLAWQGRNNLMPVSRSAYLRISEGCSEGCSFCTIPRLRGPYRSRPLKDIMQEAAELGRNMIKEINIIGQNTTAFGSDRSESVSLSSLVQKLVRLDNFRFIRILYANPKHITGDLLKTIRENQSVCRYLDIPLQHVSTPVLNRMNRSITEKKTRQLIERIIGTVPGISLRTSLMVGFPGEREADFEKLCSFVSEGHFTHLGVFAFSPERCTPAFSMPQQIPQTVKQERKNRLLRIQRRVVRTKLSQRIGKKYDVLITGQAGRMMVGRSEHEAPEIDGLIGIKTGSQSYAIGDICRVRIDTVNGYDCIGKAVA
ncbi:MAG: 30S ribosomal protein S12 methylthiotransferase RimO [Elusimicrobia bacterium]|nr:30S ribosomal protein S12 methylthiotransferase RimO [Elusimicrobiota bacterium]MBD3412570.1 30S ribosomal protein S12 methylthiotransferase RimO [Elusimicrobiota bacterium]